MINTKSQWSIQRSHLWTPESSAYWSNPPCLGPTPSSVHILQRWWILFLVTAIKGCFSEFGIFSFGRALSSQRSPYQDEDDVPSYQLKWNHIRSCNVTCHRAIQFQSWLTIWTNTKLSYYYIMRMWHCHPRAVPSYKFMEEFWSLKVHIWN